MRVLGGKSRRSEKRLGLTDRPEVCAAEPAPGAIRVLPAWVRGLVPVVALLVCLQAPLARADDAKTASRKVAVLLLLKVLTYDKGFDDRGSGEFVVLLAGEPGQRTERDALWDAIQATAPKTIRSRPLKFVRFDLDGRSDLDERVREAKASAMVVMPGLSASSVETIARVTGPHRLYTLGLDRQAVERGAALGVDTGEDGKPQIVINRPTSQAAGVDFEQSLLQRAKVIP